MKNTDEKPLKYCLTIDTSSGKCQIATESWLLLVELLDPYAYTDTQGQNIYSVAKRAQIAYHKSYKHANMVSPIARSSDLEIQIIVCYLRGWDIKKTAAWLFNEKHHKASKSAIGRYWTRLRKIGVTRVVRIEKDDDIIKKEL
jgi:hypothetical protein